MTIDSTTTRPSAATALRGLCAGAVHLPGDPGYDAARTPWNVAVDQRPAAVAYPADAAEVASVIRAAAGAGLRVAPQGTGHNAGPLGALDDVVLLRTSAMTAVRIDADHRRARVQAGALWQDAVEAAGQAGLAALHGSSPDVGVVGYSLGGGIGWYARQLGLATNSVTAIELVTADGQLVRADAEHDADLFWALRGGGGSFGVVTAMEFTLYPIRSAYAGMLVWDAAQAGAVLRRWSAWAQEAPDAATTAFRVLNLPPMPELPEAFRGRSLAVIDGAVLAEDERAAALLAPLRDLRPEVDTFGRIPATALTRLHMEPEGPTPGVSATSLLAGLPDAAADAFLAAAGPGSGSSLLSAELRQLGGALGRPHPGAGALPMLDGAFALFGVAIAATPELARQGQADAERLVVALSRHASGTPYLNFTECAVDVGDAYTESTWRRLRATRSLVDPGGLFVANHPVPRLEDSAVGY